MTTTPQGTPCWYELGTTDLAAAQRFYTAVLGWTVVDAGMEGFTYHLASAADGHGVAGIGMVSSDHMSPASSPNWLIYFTANDIDDAAAAVTADGGAMHVPPTDIPGTGRFAVLADPQGAVFGVMQPLPMPEDSAQESAYQPESLGHGAWHELLSSDPVAGFQFYARHFGWTAGEAMDMGEEGSYQLFQHGGADIGGMMGLGGAPASCWMPYFAVDSATSALERIAAAGGSAHHGPAEVPGGAFIAVAQDPQGAWFAVVGPN